MRQPAVLTIASLLSVLLMSLHLTDDILLRLSPPGIENLLAALILAVWLYGTLAIAERRAGYLIFLGGSLFGLAVFVIHIKGRGGVLGGGVGESSQAFRFVWTLLVLGATSMFSGVLSTRALLSLPWRRQRGAPAGAPGAGPSADAARPS